MQLERDAIIASRESLVVEVASLREAGGGDPVWGLGFGV